MLFHNKARRVQAGIHSNALLMWHGSVSSNSYLSPILTLSGKPLLFPPLYGSILVETALRRGSVDAAKLSVVPL